MANNGDKIIKWINKKSWIKNGLDKGIKVC